MKKRKIAKILSTAMICMSLFTTSTSAAVNIDSKQNTKSVSDTFSSDIEEVYLSDEELNEIDPKFLSKEKALTTSAKYEYTTKNSNLTVNDIDKLKKYADEVYKTNSVLSRAQSTLNYASYITGFFWPNLSLALTTANMPSYSTICPYDITSWCYDNSRYLTTKGYSKVDAQLKYRRFWNGSSYSQPWHPCEAPVTRGYIR